MHVESHLISSVFDWFPTASGLGGAGNQSQVPENMLNG